jgi:hypothetical protein
MFFLSEPDDCTVSAAEMGSIWNTLAGIPEGRDYELDLLVFDFRQV